MAVRLTEPTRETQPQRGPSVSPKQAVVYEQISRSLTEEDIKNPAVVRMIINENDSFRSENTELKQTKNKVNLLSIDNAVLRGKLKTFTAFEIISTGTIAAGSVILGSAFNPKIL